MRRALQTILTVLAVMAAIRVTDGVTREDVVSTFSALARYLWFTITAVAVLILVLMVSHLVPKKEY